MTEQERKLREIAQLVNACANSSYIPKHRVKQILESDGRKLELCEHCMQEYRNESTHILVCPYWKDKIKNG